MSVVRISPEYRIVLDPATGLIAQEREDIISYSMDPVIAQLVELDKIADDLVNSLGSEKAFMNSFPGRDSVSHTAGIYTNAFYGIIVGLAISSLIAVVLRITSIMKGMV